MEPAIKQAESRTYWWNDGTTMGSLWYLATAIYHRYHAIWRVIYTKINTRTCQISTGTPFQISRATRKILTKKTTKLRYPSHPSPPHLSRRMLPQGKHCFLGFTNESRYKFSTYVDVLSHLIVGANHLCPSEVVHTPVLSRRRHCLMLDGCLNVSFLDVTLGNDEPKFDIRLDCLSHMNGWYIASSAVRRSFGSTSSSLSRKLSTTDEFNISLGTLKVVFLICSNNSEYCEHPLNGWLPVIIVKSVMPSAHISAANLQCTPWCHIRVCIKGHIAGVNACVNMTRQRTYALNHNLNSSAEPHDTQKAFWYCWRSTINQHNATHIRQQARSRL